MDYKATLNLPQTTFPMKADLPQREPGMLAWWNERQVYAAMQRARAGAPRFVLHDGPPYANGHIHFGHILNKVLKDIVVKSRAMAGFATPFVPGWDCHGLPIELAAEKELGEKRHGDSALEMRRACRVYAEQFVAIQRGEFQRLGCLGDWEHPYRTMDFGYQAEIVRQFARFVEKGLVYSGKKPIYWCASCRTALAEAEVEYDAHRSPSIYVRFPLRAAGDLCAQWGVADQPVHLVIWTTTPWTLPANLAVALHPELPYVAVAVGGEIWIVAADLLEPMMAEVAVTDYRVLAPVAATALERRQCAHPLLPKDSLVILGDHVTLDAGTGCVHTAPGHGQEDYVVCKHYGIEPFAPVDDRGCFTADAGLPWLSGVFVAKANAPIIEHLRSSGRLVHDAVTEHQYPHCWRCKRPIIFRSTEQWFVSMEQRDLRGRAMAAIDQVTWVPAWGRNRIHGMMDHRPDWCISRQRVWGVPIPAVRCGACGERGTTPALVHHVANRIAAEGADCWYRHEVADLLPPGYACPHCHTPSAFTKERDILDVWFDSGSSFAAVLERQMGVGFPADLYLEGSDQHRGWFHTSLLIGIGAHDQAPYKTVLTHGFVVDGQGKKYSKSAKNYVPPEKIINQYGAELLRLWVAAEDYRNDIRVSEEILTRLAESYRKIRNSWRYILGNLYDFNPARDLVPHTSLPAFDRWMLHECAQLIARCRRAYDEYEFHVVYHAVNAFCTVQLSALYMDMSKDRLYCEAPASAARRSAQTVLWHAGDLLTRLLAPILSFTAEEVWQVFPRGASIAGSVFETDLPAIRAGWADDALADRWARLWQIRETATKALEEARRDKVIGNALGAQVCLRCDPSALAFLQSFGESLVDWLQVSQLRLEPADGHTGVTVQVTPASGEKCARCWKFRVLGEVAQYPDACARCAHVLQQIAA